MQDLEQIYKQYFETVNKYLFCLTHNSDISEELTQETFYRAVKKINTFKGECKMSVWLCQIAKNLWYDELKKNKKLGNIEQTFLIQSEDNLEENIILNENKLELYRKLQKLDKQTREVIYLRITGELSFREIGDILNKTENWARVTFYRGKQKLKECD
jgi:RNA polymerase sigma-70 factor (ECF subfamily)